MQGQTIIATHDVDELFISTIVRLIQRRFPEPPKYHRQNTFSGHLLVDQRKHRTMETTAPKTENISPDEALEVCARQIIVNYFHQMMSYKEGAKDGSDIEFVHEMRVTSRRLRAAMDNFVDCFPEKAFNKHYKKVKSITRTLGVVRDLDVLIARFEKELAALPESEQADIRGLIEHLQQEHENARKPMLRLFTKLEETGFEIEFLEFFVGGVCNPDEGR